VGKYRVTTRHTPETLFELFSLRHDIFYQEHHQTQLDSGLDIDEIDFLCDHLSIFDKTSGRVVGTYRITSSDRSKFFYSSHRFDLRPLLRLPGVKLELGRACVAFEYRRGSVIALLWKGIGEYCLKADARYLFGCASIRTTQPRHAHAFTAWLKDNGHFSEGLELVPHEERAFSPGEGKRELPFPLPPLFQAYLKAGAKIVSQPAYDRKLRCADFLTLLDLRELSEKHLRRYATSSSALSIAESGLLRPATDL
jgi:putative hemolysin